jgi:hypothetical protein
MKKYLLKVEETLQEKLDLLVVMSRRIEDNPMFTGRFGNLETAITSNQTLVGKIYLLKAELSNVIFKFERIKEYCISEINGTFYEDELDGWTEDYNPQKDNAHSYILRMFEDDDFILSDELKKYISSIADYNLQMTGALFGLLGEIGANTATSGRMLQEQYRQDYKTQANLLECYDSFLQQLKTLAETKGNLGQIIKFVE